MQRAEHVQDLDTAKQMLALYEKENARLHKRLQELVREVARLRGHDDGEQLELEISKLQEQMANLQRKVFGDSSEKRPRPNNVEAEKTTTPQRGHGPKAQPELPIEEWTTALPDDKRQCSSCGGRLEAIKGMTEDSEAISASVGRVFVLHLRRQKYRCKCGGPIVTAPGPTKHIPGGRYTADFAVQVGVAKYADHNPLERQCRMYERQGLRIDSQTLWDQVNGLAKHFEPTYNALHEYICGSDIVGADETWWRLMGQRSSKKYWVWGLTTHNACWYRIADSRSAKIAEEVLAKVSGTVLCDGYKAYETVAKARPDLRLAHCWAHVRRKFIEAAEHYPAMAEPALELIGKLFAIEAEMKDPDALEGDEKLLAIEIRSRQRERESKPILEKLKAWALEQRAAPKHAVRRAIEYMFSYWRGLTVFVDDPMLSIHNNATERALRGMVLGRKNHFGSRSIRGTEVAAIMYSLIESAKLCGVDPYRYLLRLADVAVAKPGAVLLPHDYAAL